MKVIGAIERVRGLSELAFQRDFAAREIPVILEGAADAWPARQRWTPDGLRSRIGALATRYKSSGTHRHPDFRAGTRAEMFATEEGTFGQFIDRLGTAHGERYLLTGEEEFLLRKRPGKPDERNEKLATLLDDFPLPPFFAEASLYSSWLWMSARGVRTWLHYDTNGCHNLNAQVQGHKRVWLFEPDWLNYASPFPLGGSVPAYNCSRVDVEAPEAFPEFAQIECFTGELATGDLLFLPANWLHTFLHEGTFNANVNFWWKPDAVRPSRVSERLALLDEVTELGGFGALNRQAQATFTDRDQRILAVPRER